MGTKINKVQRTIVRFGLDSPELTSLCRADKRLATVITHHGDLQYSLETDGFSFAVKTIIGQMLSSKAADAISSRLQALCIDDISPSIIGRLEHHQLRDIGLSSQKSYYIKGFAELIENSPEFLSALAAMQDTAAIECLVRVRGIGAWSAKMYLIFFLNRMDVLPYEDTAFTQAYKMLYGVTKTCRKEMIENCKAWKPYSSLAARYLYIALDNGFFRDSSFQRRLETEKAPNSPLCESS